MSASLALSLLLRLGAASLVFTLVAGLLLAVRRRLRARLGAGAAVLLLRQRASWRALGPLRPGPDGTWLSLRPDAGPLLAGLPRPRIVLPAGFAERYDPAELAAVLAHERLHARRGDLWWNALAALPGRPGAGVRQRGAG